MPIVIHIGKKIDIFRVKIGKKKTVELVGNYVCSDIDEMLHDKEKCLQCFNGIFSCYPKVVNEEIHVVVATDAVVYNTVGCFEDNLFDFAEENLGKSLTKKNRAEVETEYLMSKIPKGCTVEDYQVAVMKDTVFDTQYCLSGSYIERAVVENIQYVAEKCDLVLMGIYGEGFGFSRAFVKEDSYLVVRADSYYFCIGEQGIFSWQIVPGMKQDSAVAMEFFKNEISTTFVMNSELINLDMVEADNISHFLPDDITFGVDGRSLRAIACVGIFIDEKVKKGGAGSGFDSLRKLFTGDRD